MKAFVSVDYEGLPGIVSTTMLGPRSSQFGRSVEIVSRVVGVVAGVLLENGFDRVVVADSHGAMTNIDYLRLPRGVSLVQGFPRPYSMLTGLDEGFNGLFMIGYHSGAGTLHGFLDHSYSGRAFYRIYINGVQASEYLVNALVAGELGVPVALVAGDTRLEEEVRRYTPWSVFIGLKTGISRYAAEFNSFEEVLESLRRGVYIAIQRIRRREVKPLVFEIPLEARIELRETLYADVVETLPGVERVDAYTIVYKSDSPRKILGLIEAIALMVAGVEYLKQKLV